MTSSLIIQFRVEGKRPLHHDPGSFIMLDAFDLGELGVLGTSLCPGLKWVRAKDAKDAKGLEGGRFFGVVGGFAGRGI